MSSSYMLAPSVLSANFLTLGSEIETLNNSEADWIHFDVMDGHFVPNISFGLTVLEAVAPVAQKPIDVHLMITAPERYVEKFAQFGASNITIHLEATTSVLATIAKIKALGCRAGLAINPHTPIGFIEPTLIEAVDIINIMSVNPGFGGQPFIVKSLDKIKDLRKRIDQISKQTLIEVDGGITAQNIGEVLQAGADVVVAGSFIFKSPNPQKVISDLKQHRTCL